MDSVEPRKGIKSGGTIVKITGKNLLCGSYLEFLIENGKCTILNSTVINNTEIIQCQTPASREWGQKASLLKLKMDNYVKELNEPRFKFLYVDDPLIFGVDSESTISSGGLVLNVKGKDLDTIQNAALVLSTSHLLPNKQPTQSSMFKSKCHIFNSSLLKCEIPHIDDYRLTSESTQMVEYFLYIQFNELTSKFFYERQIQVFADPTFDHSQIFTDQTPIVLIKGENLLRGVKESDYRVWIGAEAQCNITSITMNLIACILPNQNDIALHNEHADLNGGILKRSLKDSYELRVQIGRKLIRSIGFLKYEKNTLLKYDVVQIKYIIAAACVTSLVLMITMTTCFVVLKRRQNKQIRQLKLMQCEFENLEMRVARECKEAFTELQMDIGELANTLNQTGAPFNDYQKFCVKILLPNASDAERYLLTTTVDLRVKSYFRHI